MPQSMNTKVDLSIKGTSYFGITTYGTVLVGDKAFEYYNERNVNDYIQIPWEEITYVSASVVTKKWIPRFAIFTKSSGHFTFSTRDNKKTLRAIRTYLGDDLLLKSPTFLGTVSKGFKSLFKK